jgi:hypothetical protein
MTALELRQCLHAQIDRVPEAQLLQIQNYLAELVADAPMVKQSTGGSLLAAMQSIGTWQGDDFEACLQSVYESRSPVSSNEDNPFD